MTRITPILFNLRGLIIEGANVGTTGIRFNTGATLTIENCVLRNLAQGTDSSGTIDMVVSDSVAAGNTNVGIRANSLLAAITTLTVVRSASTGDGTGVSVANPNARVRVAQSTIAGNATGWLAQSGGTFESYGDNYVNGNAAGEAAMPSIARK